MNLEMNRDTLEVIQQFHLPTFKEIPDVGLYLDQTSKIINQYLESIPDCAITNSMISNYVKHKLIANPVKKQYYREHIAYLIFIALTKSAVSLDSFGLLFQMQKEYGSVERAYNYFVREFEGQLAKEFGFASGETTEVYDKQKQLLSSIIKVVVSKIYLDEMLRVVQKENEK